MQILISFAFIIVIVSSQCDEEEFSFGDTCLNQCPMYTLQHYGPDQKECRECDITKSFVLNQYRNQCICTAATFYDQNLEQCISCHYSCMSCYGPEINQCLTCDLKEKITQRIYKQGFCLCPVGYYDDQNLQNSVCQKCHSDCYTCDGPNEDNCIRCAQGRYKNEQGYCFCNTGFIDDEENGGCLCPQPFIIDDGVCKSSNNKCGYGEENVNVKKGNIAKIGRRGKPFECRCRPGLFRIKGVCKTCKQNQQYNEDRQICQCPRNGFKHQGECIICEQNQIFKKKAGKCVCRKNQFLNENNQCIRCRPKQVYTQGQCKCIPNYFRNFRSGNCQKCNRRSDNPACLQFVVDQSKELTLDQIQKKN